MPHPGFARALKARGWRVINRAVLVAVKAAAPHHLDEAGPVLIVQTAAIGDFVLTTPLIRALAHAFPDRGLVLAVSPRLVPLATGCPHVSTVVPVSTEMSKVRMLHNLVAVFRSSRVIARLRPSIAVVPRFSLDPFFESAIAVLSGAPIRVGFAEGCSADRARRNVSFDEFFTATHPGVPGLQESRQQLQLLDLLGVPADGDAPDLWWNQEDERAVDALLVPGGQYVALAPGATSAFRRWPPDRFAAVGATLASGGWTPVVVGGPHDDNAAQIILRQVPTAINACGLELRAAAAALARCRLAIANDSGPAHMAAAVGAPLVIVSPHPIDAPSDHDNAPERVGPLGVATTILRPVGAVECQNGCTGRDAHCINEISVADVLLAVAGVLAAVATPTIVSGPSSD